MKHAADPFERLYNENYQRVCQLLTRIVGPQEAEDLAQIVFAKAARALPGFRGDAQASKNCQLRCGLVWRFSH